MSDTDVKRYYMDDESYWHADAIDFVPKGTIEVVDAASHDAAMAAKDAEIADLKTTLERYEFSFEHQERKNGFLNDKIQEYHEQLVWDAMQTEDTLKRKRAVESDLETAQALIAALERKVAQQASEMESWRHKAQLVGEGFTWAAFDTLENQTTAQAETIAALKATVAEQASELERSQISNEAFMRQTRVIADRNEVIDALKGDVAALLEACEQLKVDAEYLASDIVSEPAQHPSRVKAFHTMYRLVDRVVLAHTERTAARQPDSEGEGEA